MRFVLADKHLVVAGHFYEGFPLLLNDNCETMEPAQTFLWDILGKSGRITSKLTWESYGRAVYDFFGYVLANGMDWQRPSVSGVPGAVENWRDWSKGTLGLDTSTINQRLRVIVRFYKWAVKEGYIPQVPFDVAEVRTNRTPGFLDHVDERGGRVETPNVMLQEKARNIRILTKDQIVACHEALQHNVTHALMFETLARTGLRQIELRTFPFKYVFDPSRRKDLNAGQKIRVGLDHRDMKLKYDKDRGIDVPYDLMEKLWAYAVRRRQKRADANRDGEALPNVFLTEAGIPYSKEAITKIFRTLAKRVGFVVTAHMLRHSYATYLLWTLRKSQTFLGEPLLYVRDRLGHSDISTTTLYLHLIQSLEAEVVLAHEDEIDQLFAEPAQP